MGQVDPSTAGSSVLRQASTPAARNWRIG
jgi:hypothetical protein